MAGVVTNLWVANRAAAARTYLLTNHEIRLFKNDYVPDPTTVVGNLVECNFDTYARQNLDGKVSVASFVQDGRYRCAIGPFAYAPPTVTGNTIYGWFIVFKPTSTLELVERFGVPLPFPVGAAPFELLCRSDDLSTSIL